MNIAHECHNPSFNDMTLEQQIEVGINDWRVYGRDGHPYFGRTAAEAEAIRDSCEKHLRAKITSSAGRRHADRCEQAW